MTIALILSWLIFGFIVGLIARAIYPGAQGMSLLGTAALGIVGSFVGGIIGNLLYGGELFVAHASGFIGSLIGALVVLGLMSLANRRSHA